MERQDLIAYFLKEYYPRGEAAYRLPVSIAVSEIWPEILRARRARAVELSVSSWDGHAYWYVPTEKFLRAGDEFVEAVRDETISQFPQYAHNEGIIDEAYYSSVIEGAYTTRQRAREFIASGQPPRDRSERMVLNNYEALRFVLQNLDAPIDEKIILEIGRILTEDTLDEGVNAGYRNGDVQVVSGRQEVVYIAPDARYVKPMMKELIEYIADENIHPVVRACVAHIYLVTIHPFADGNGRTARALSYMILLRAGYHFVRQFPISGILAQERTRYYKAIRASQSPENGYDFTYFLEYYAEMLCESVKGIHAHMSGMRCVERLRKALGGEVENERLIKGAEWLVSENITTITAEKWRVKFRISFETARRDLMKLEGAGFIARRTVGRKFFYDLKTE